MNNIAAEKADSRGPKAVPRSSEDERRNWFLVDRLRTDVFIPSGNQLNTDTVSQMPPLGRRCGRTYPATLDPLLYEADRATPSCRTVGSTVWEVR
jgi:hypothetical protein